MADYYPLLARAVAALPNSSPETRASIYDRARKALLGQLRSLDPPVSPEHLQTESNALDDAIARLEAELAQGAVKSDAAPPPPPPKPAAQKPAAPPDSPPAARPAPPPPPPFAPRSPPRSEPPPAQPALNAAAKPAPPPAAGSSERKPADTPARTPHPQGSVDSRAPEQRKDASADLDAPLSRRKAEEKQDETPAVLARPPSPANRGETIRPVAPSRPESGRAVSRQVLIWIPLILLIGGGIGFAAWSLRVPQEEFSKPRVSVADTRQPQSSGKINDRADAPAGAPASPQQQPQQRPQEAPAAPSQQTAAQQSATQQPAAQQPAPQSAPVQQQAQQQQPLPQRPPEQAAPVAQRSAILVQAAVNDMQNVDTHVGTVVWRTEESRRPGANGSPAVRADVDVPAIGLRVVFLIEKNNDATLRASHMLTIRFLPQEGSSLPAIAEIGSPQMRNEAAPAVEPLTGAQAKITDNIYIVALNADPTIASRNLETMRNRGWFDFPLRLTDGRIAKITFEKGPPGERLLNQALEQWQR